MAKFVGHGVRHFFGGAAAHGKQLPLGDCFWADGRRDNTNSTRMAHAIHERRCDHSLLHTILAQKWANARYAGLAHQARNRGRGSTFYYAVRYAMRCRSAIAGGLRVGLLVVFF